MNTVSPTLKLHTHWYPEQTPEYVRQACREREVRLGINWSDAKWQLPEEPADGSISPHCQHVNDQIVDVTWAWSDDGEGVTCFIEARNGQSVSGRAPCATLKDFQDGVGREASRLNAVNRLSFMEIYVQATDEMRQRQALAK